jgi:16S rRNA (guanine(1405)-N(7))-methyltransferase
MKLDEFDVQKMVRGILNSRKYRSLGLNLDTVRDLIQQEAPQHSSSKTLQKSVRRKLHNIIAPYLGEPDYDRLSKQLRQLKNVSIDSTALKSFCRGILSEHASTAERIPKMREFYSRLFQVTGKPKSILDLACGLHPLAFPWMELPLSTQYHAYDIIQPRIDFINSFFERIGLTPLAENRDILVDPPQIHADLGIFFKEAHRIEKRQPGCNRAFWTSLNVDVLAVSLPTQDLSGTHSLLEQHRQLVNDNLPGNADVQELLFEDEIVFLIH